MVKGVEIDMVVTDSLKAFAWYRNVFEAECVEITDFPTGSNEAIFTIANVRFHLLDENPDFQLVAPRLEDPKPMWINFVVDDIDATWTKVTQLGGRPIQEPAHIEAFGVSNAIFVCPYGYVWMLHQIHRVITFEEKMQIWSSQTLTSEGDDAASTL